MKWVFWAWGIMDFLYGMLPYTFTGKLLGLSPDAACMADTLSMLRAMVAIGLGCILHEMQKNRQGK